MSTRSMIAKQIAEDEYLAVYCHQDGYLSHNGALLLDCYNTPEKVDALLALGELSHLGKDMEAAPHEIADLKGMEGVTVATAGIGAKPIESRNPIPWKSFAARRRRCISMCSRWSMRGSTITEARAQRCPMYRKTWTHSMRTTAWNGRRVTMGG